jgi:hypothetical protein
MRKNLIGLLAMCMLGIAIFSSQNCAFSAPQFIKTSTDKGRAILVLVDETRSFQQYWDQIIQHIQTIAGSLKKGDTFAVSAVNGAEYGSNNYRIDLTDFKESNFLKAKLEKRNLDAQIKNLHFPQNPSNRTNIWGSLLFSADLLKKISNEKTNPSEQRDCILLIFSDMEQTASKPKADAMNQFSFPQGTRIYGFYLDATQSPDWKTATKVWVSALSKAHAIVTSNDFFPAGETTRALARILQR